MRRRKVRFGMLRDGDIAEIWQRWRAGEDQPAIAAALACSKGVVSDVIGLRGGVAPVAYAVPPWKRSLHRLRPTDREEISRRLLVGESFHRIAHDLKRAPSTISREVRRNGGRVAYRPSRPSGRPGSGSGGPARRGSPAALACATRSSGCSGCAGHRRRSRTTSGWRILPTRRCA